LITEYSVAVLQSPPEEEGFVSPLIPLEPLEACGGINQFPDEVLTEIPQVLEFG
jgi:hypothetical protein